MHHAVFSLWSPMSRPIGVVDPVKRDCVAKIGIWTCCWFQGGWLVIFVADGIRLGGERWGPVNAALNPTPGVAMRWAAWVRSAYCHVWMETEFTDLIKNAPTDGEAKKFNCRIQAWKA